MFVRMALLLLFDWQRSQSFIKSETGLLNYCRPLESLKYYINRSAKFRIKDRDFQQFCVCDHHYFEVLNANKSKNRNKLHITIKNTGFRYAFDRIFSFE